MENHDLRLTEYDAKIFKAGDGADPFQFALYIPVAAVEMTRMGADALRTQLLNIIPGYLHEIHVVEQVTIGTEKVIVKPHMLVLRLDYLDHEARYITMSFTPAAEDLVLH